MNTTQRILHQFLNDLRSHRAALITLIGICAAFLLLDRFQTVSVGYDGITFAIFILTGGILALVILATVVTSDPAVGDEAFWMTRPIRGKEMAGSKLLVLLVIYVPLAFAWLCFPLLEFGKNGADYYIHDFWTVTTPALAAALAAASFSKRLPHFAILFISILAGGAIGLSVVYQTSPLELRMDWTQLERESSLMIAYGIFLIGAVFVSILQYLHGYRHVHSGIVVLTILIGSLCYVYLRVDFITKSIDTKVARALGFENFQIKIPTDRENIQRGDMNHMINGKLFEFSSLLVPLDYTGLPDGYSLESITFKNGSITGGAEFHDLPPGFNERSRHRSFTHIESSLPGYRIYTSHSRDDTQSLNLFRIDKSGYQSIEGTKVDFNAKAQCMVTSLVKFGSLPFGKEGVISAPGFHFNVSSSTDDNGINCSLSGRMRSHFLPRSNRFDHDSPTVVLVNNKRKEAVYSNGGGGGGHSNARHVYKDMNYGFSRTFWFDSTRGNQRQRFEVTYEWLADAEVVLFYKKEVGIIATPVSAIGIILP